MEMEKKVDVVKKEKWSTRTMVKVSMLSVIAVALMFVNVSVPFAPPFLKVDLGDLPALIGGFALGTVPGIVVVLLKNILNIVLQGSTTAYVGELSNFIVGSMFVIVSSQIYKHNKTKKGAILGLVFGVLIMTTVATLSNYFVIFPMYSKLFGWPMDKIIALGTKVNHLVTDYNTMMIYAVVPFNLVKGFIVSLVTLLLYKPLSPILHRKQIEQKEHR